MVKVLIVDDEPIILEGLQKIIPWEDYDFKIVAVASDGEIGLQKIKDHSPDIVITDIRMNFLNGIELIKAAKQMNSNMGFVAITAYSDFEYVKEACNIGVSSYILKPIVKDELLDAMLSLKKRILQQADTAKKIKRMSKLLKDEYPVLIGHFLQNIFKNELNPDEINNKAKLLNINIKDGYEYSAAIIKTNDLQDSFDTINNSADGVTLSLIKRIADEIVGNEYSTLSACLDEDEIGFLIWKDKIDSKDRTRIDELLDRSRLTVKTLLKLTVSVARGAFVDRFKDIPYSYKDACKALEYSLVSGTDKFIASEQIRCDTGKHCCYPSDIEKKVLDDIRYHDICSLRADMDSFVKYYQDSGCSYAHMSIAFHQLFASILRPFEESGPDIVEYDKIFYALSKLKGKPAGEIAGFLCKYTDELINKLIKRYPRFIDQIIKDVLSNIKRDIFDSRLNLSTTAEKVHMNATYLGQLFKKVLGKSFVQYVTELRIEEAKRLLKNPYLKVYEVADKVGYDNFSYFNVVFKKYMGMSPTDYRAGILKNNG